MQTYIRIYIYIYGLLWEWAPLRQRIVLVVHHMDILWPKRLPEPHLSLFSPASPCHRRRDHQARPRVFSCEAEGRVIQVGP